MLQLAKYMFTTIYNSHFNFFSSNWVVFVQYTASRLLIQDILRVGHPVEA
jgi:hypothetical protein